MVNNDRDIDNAKKLLSIKYRELNGKRFKNLDIRGLQNIDDLFATIIVHWITSIIKEGMYKHYVSVENEVTSSPRGSIDVQETITRQTMANGMVVCDYDELDEDINVNQALRAMLDYIIYEKEISDSIKKEAIKVRQSIIRIQPMSLTNSGGKIGRIQFTNDTMRYKNIIEISNIFLRDRRMKNAGVIDENKRLYMIFKDQMRNWFEAKCTEYDVELVEEEFDNKQLEPQFEVETYKKQRIVLVKNDDIAIIICTRLKDEVMIEDSTVMKKQMTEVVRYLKTYETELKIPVNACMVYVNTDKQEINMKPITVESIDNRKVGVTTVDIHDNWNFIEAKLNDIYKYFMVPKRLGARKGGLG